MEVGDLVKVATPGYKIKVGKPAEIVDWAHWQGIIVQIYENKTDENKPIMEILDENGTVVWAYLSDKIEVINGN